MKSLCATILLLAFSSFGFAQNQTTWDGFVTDTHCGTHCQRTSAMTPDRAWFGAVFGKAQNMVCGTAIMSTCWNRNRRLLNLPPTMSV